MQFDVLKDPNKVAAIREKLSASNTLATEGRGALVRYVMPSMPPAFPQLAKVLDESSHRRQFLDIHYYIQTKERRLRRLLPAAEYYKFVFRAVADKQYSLRVGFRRVRELQQRIDQAHRQTRETMPRTAQPSFRVTDEVYALKSEVASVLFVARGVLDTVASLMHFLYGPRSPQFTSFADFVKFLRKSARQGASHDPEFLEYVDNHMEWFRTLRDYRDYVTHHSSIDVSFYEPTPGQLLIYLQDVVQAEEIVTTALFGVDGFCAFVDQHFAARIQAAA